MGIQALAAAMGTNTTLTSLNLHFNDLGPLCAAAIAAAVPNGVLRTLDLAGWPQFRV